jgi:hypothetical protein
MASPTVSIEPSTTDQTDIATKLKALEQRWEGSFMAHVVSVLEELVADDFVGTSSSGKVGTKATMIAEARKDKNVYTSAVSSDMVVHQFGPNVAVVTGIVRETGKTASGKAFSQAFQWQCVAASALALPKK